MGRLYSLLGKQDYYVIRAGDSKRGEAASAAGQGIRSPLQLPAWVPCHHCPIVFHMFHH
jgi:hypothetical protein